jgi:cyclic pyranopterin phosphate synthase
MIKLSHINRKGEAEMVDVSEKAVTMRIATASGKVIFPPKVFNELKHSQFSSKKGGIIQTAVIAGIQGVKQTAHLIPLCHPLRLSKIDIRIEPVENALYITCTVKCNEKTGVEMEALTGVSVSALTIYDMCKALSHEIKMTDIQLEEKSGGKNDYRR